MKKSKDTTNQAEKKPIFKKWWFWVVVVMVIAVFGSTSQPQTAEPAPSPSPIQSEVPASTQPEAERIEQFVEQVKTMAPDSLGYEHESILDVVFQNGDLCVYVDLGEEGATPFPLEHLAISMASGITDDILDLEECDDLWETVTVDFGEVGRITNSKENIVVSEYGRYFDFKDSDLKK